MKTLANCRPSEFLAQTNRIRRSVSRWLTDTDIVNIRKRMPVLDADASEEERKNALDRQATENLNAILDAVLEDHPEETLEVLALVCFIEPENADEHTVTEYIDALAEILGNDSVINFFTSLMQSVSRLT